MSPRLCAGWSPMNIRRCPLTNGFESQTLRRSHRDAVFSSTNQVLTLSRLLGFLLHPDFERAALLPNALKANIADVYNNLDRI